MFLKFFEDTIESKFIKNLLYNTPLPILDTVQEGDYLLQDIYYIYGVNILKCTKSGILYRYSDLENHDDSCEYVVLGSYYFGNEVNKITENFKSNIGYYDPDTHLYLGKFLRCLRDIYGVDLLPFYNCFNYKVIPDVYLSKYKQDETLGNFVIGANDKYKVIAVPIRFNREYTIAVDCSTEVLIKSVFYGKYGLIRNSKGEFSYVCSELLEDTCTQDSNYIKYNTLRFNSPIKYKITNTEEKFGLDKAKRFLNLEKYLYLLIQLPKENKSSICVIEADTTHREDTIINVPHWISSSTHRDANKILISDLSLLQFNTKNSYAFSDRLIENLLLNVINHRDLISQNVVRIQRMANLDVYVSHSWGIFSLYDRYELYKRYMNSNDTRHIDISGFVDKDMEKFVTKGFDV